MSIDSNDPNEPMNYDNSQAQGEFIPNVDPVTQQGTLQASAHPVLSVLASYLKRFPLIGTWTIMEDILDHSAEIRIKLHRSEKSVTKY